MRSPSKVNPVPIVQFASQIMYTAEGSTSSTKVIEVMRIGGMNETCVVAYGPEDEDNSLEGTKFHKCTGTLEFGPGESVKSFELRLIENKLFDSVVELPFKLTAVKNCELGAYLHRTRVKIIDDDTFPTPKFASEILRDPSCDSWKQGCDFTMLIEFAKLCYSIKRDSAMWIMVGDQINNIIYIFQLYLGKELITTLSDPDESAWGNEAGVFYYAILLTFPYAYSHLFSYRKQFWKVGGTVRKEMLQDLMVRCLYYEEATRDEVNSAELKETFAHHVFKLVGDGYMQFFEVAAALGRLVLLLGFFLFNAFDRLLMDEGGPQLFYFIILFFATPVVTYIYVRIRLVETTKTREQTEDSKVDLMNYMDSVNDSYRVVADCWARPLVLADVLKKVGRVNANLVKQGARQANDMAFFGWTSELVDGFVIILGGMMVLNNHPNGLPLGVFTATMAGLRGANGQYLRLYKAALSMQSTFPALWLLVQYMNLPMDLDQRMLSVERNRKEWSEHFATAQKDERVTSGDINIEDAMPIILKDVQFEYKVNLLQKLCSKSAAPSKATSVDLLKRVNLQIPQGQLVGVTGPPGHGKGTLLRVLAEVLMPTSGSIFVPSHLRVLHVELQETLYEGSVAFNVYFALLASRGLQSVDDLRQDERDRGVRVCKALDMIPQVVEAVEKYKERKGTHLKSLSLTTRIRIQLARALIVNPEVLVLHMPMDSLREAQAKVVLDQLHKFVTNKGVELPEDHTGSRRPRTCIFTSNHKHFLMKADTVWSVVEGEMREKVFLEGASPRGSTMPPISDTKISTESDVSEDPVINATSFSTFGTLQSPRDLPPLSAPPGPSPRLHTFAESTGDEATQMPGEVPS